MNSIVLLLVSKILIRGKKTERFMSISSTQFNIPRVLSIQSHTVHGYVGNKAATFPMQTMGFDVDCINTVALSNHPAYPNGCKGKSLEDAELTSLFDGLEANSLIGYDILLSGYCRSSSSLVEIGRIVQKIRQHNSKSIFVCDPVLGDNGRFYVPEELATVYKEKVIPFATAITPNYFEANVLSGIEVNTLETAMEACEKLHLLGPKICVLKGLRLDDDKSLSVVVSYKQGMTRYGDAENGSIVFKIDHGRVNGNFSGCGDLFTSIFTAILHHCVDMLQDNPFLLGHVLELTVRAMSDVVGRTSRANSKELQIVQSRDTFIRTVGSLKALLSAVNSSERVPRSDNFDAEVATEWIPVSTLVKGASNEEVAGVIFDMDGTLTEPGAIDFGAMYRRTGLRKSAAEDIVTQIMKMSESDRQRAMQIIYEEEMFGCDRMQLRSHLHLMLDTLDLFKIPLAIATRNCEEAFARFATMAKVDTSFFQPVVVRDSLGGVNKPNPAVAQHILQQWGVAPVNIAKVWFVGDSIDDMLCGKKAGCRTCLMLTDYNRRLAPEHPGLIDLEVENLKEFAAHIQRLIVK